MANSVGTVGAVSAPPTPVGTWQQDLWAKGADVTYTAADLIILAVNQGALLSDGTKPTAIHSIDADLKPIGGEGEFWDGSVYVTVAATASNAKFTDNGGTTNIDPAGSRTSQGMVDDGTLGASTFQSVLVAEGSIVKVSVTFI